MVSTLIFILGLIVGSFLNAVIYRLGYNDSVMKGRSYCPHCHHQLSWQDLIPLVSFLLLRGRGRYCERRISWQYPVVEISTGLIFLLIFNFEFRILNEFSNFLILQTAYLFTIVSLLIVLFAYDLKHYILPDKILFPAIGIVLGYRVFEFLNLNDWDLFGIWSLGFGAFAPLVNAILSAIFAAAFFFAIFAVSKGRAMGFGDVKLALFMGLFLGYPAIVIALYSAFMIGGILGLLLIAMKRKQMKSEVPFGPFLITGTFIALFWGDSILQWYKAFL